MGPRKKKLFTPRTTIPATPMFMRKDGSRKMTLMTLSTDTVFGGLKTVGYKPGRRCELDKLIDLAAHPDLRVALVNLSLPPVSHVFMIMKVPNELRIYDVQNRYAEMGGVPSHYTDCENSLANSDGYRFFVDGLLVRLRIPKEGLRLMSSPELTTEEWEMIDHSAETERPLEGDTRGACLLWCDAVLNRHWRQLLEEAYSA